MAEELPILLIFGVPALAAWLVERKFSGKAEAADGGTSLNRTPSKTTAGVGA